MRQINGKASILIGLILMSGCGDSSTGPDEALIGRWGGGGIELIATERNVFVSAPCGAQLTGRGPIIPYQGQRFIISLDLTRPQGSGPNSQSTGAYALSGVISGDKINAELTAITIGGTFTQAYQLTRNAPQGGGPLECG
jgi:hypothetical protein